MTTALLQLGASIIGGAAALDLLTPPSLKPVLHHRLSALWVRLHDTRIPQLPAALAAWCLRVMSRVAGPKLFSLRSVFIFVAVDWVLTSAAMWVGMAIDGADAYQLVWNTPLPHWVFYVVNLPLDLVTVLATVFALKLVHRLPQWTLPVVIVDLAAALALMFACFAAGFYCDRAITYYPIPPSLNDETRDSRLRRSAPWAVGEATRDGFSDAASFQLVPKLPSVGDFRSYLEGLLGPGAMTVRLTLEVKEGTRTRRYTQSKRVATNAGLIFYASTTLMPTLAFLLAVVVAYMAKFVVEACRLLALVVLESVTHQNPRAVRNEPMKFMPCTILGTILTFLWTIVSTSWRFVLG